MLSDGLARRRFTVNGFTNDPQGLVQLRSFVESLTDNQLSSELARRIRESGMI